MGQLSKKMGIAADAASIATNKKARVEAMRSFVINAGETLKTNLPGHTQNDSEVKYFSYRIVPAAASDTRIEMTYAPVGPYKEPVTFTFSIGSDETVATWSSAHDCIQGNLWSGLEELATWCGKNISEHRHRLDKALNQIEAQYKNEFALPYASSTNPAAPKPR